VRKLLWLAAASAALSVAGQAAASTVLFNEDWNPANVGGYSTVDGYRWADPFSLATASTVTTVTWYGSSYVGGDLTGIGFDADFYANASGAPGASVGHFSGTPTFTDTGSQNRDHHEVYLFTMNIDPVSLSGGTTYLFSVAAHGGNADSQFIWEESSQTNGAWSTNGGGAYRPNMGEAQAFSLIGTVSSGAPEPEAWALMIMGLGGVGGLLRRRRVQSLA
jgi:hypothetical protein